MAPGKNDNWVRRFEVLDTRTHSRGFTVYKVVSVVFPKAAPEAITKVVVWKRYNDFKKLHSKLKQYHKSCKISEEFPKLCKAKYFKRFEEDVIKERMECALVLLNFIGRHQALFTCNPFLEFFENGYQLPDTSSMPPPELLDNGNVVPSEDTSDAVNTFNIVLADPDKQEGLLRLGGTWNAHLTSETISIHSRSSDDDDSFLTSDNTGSMCSIPTNGSFDNPSTFQQNDVEDPARLSQSSHASDLPDHCSPAGQTVTCYSEKPIPNSEVWFTVGTHDLQDSPEPSSTATETWATPPGSPLNLHQEDYLVEAAYQVGCAQNHEASGEYAAAFSFYKGAIACLLDGVHDDKDKVRRLAVRDKIGRYLQRADKLYSLHLAGGAVPASVAELRVYKVLAVLDTVMLVLHREEDKCYVVKVLHKSPCPVDPNKKTIVPRHVPYMVQLVRHLETDHCVFLVLQYASGGRLLDHIDNYLSSMPSTPVRDKPTPFPVTAPEPVQKVRDESYMELIKQYTACAPDDRLLCYQKDEGDVKIIPETILRSESHIIFDKETLNLVECATEPIPDVEPHEEVSLEELQVTDLLENSQRLLESVNKTLQKSETERNTLSRELEEIEALELQQKPPEQPADPPPETFQVKPMKKRSFSALPRPRFERRFSDDLVETRSRTASNSLDRCGQWSRLASMVEPTRARLSEGTIRGWAAELLVALETLHRWGLVCSDLRPENLLLGDHGHLLITFQSQWSDVDSVVSQTAVANLYAAPETSKVFPITAAADWWSYGALLFQLLTGQSLLAAHPGGIYNHSILNVPECVSPEAASLLTELLRYEPGERLGGGVNGSDDVKNHPFFISVDWQIIYDSCLII